MTNVSRREFFRLVSNNVADQISHVFSESQNQTQNICVDTAYQAQGGWSIVGRFTDLTPGVKLDVVIGQSAITLNSNSEGIWALNSLGSRIALRSGMGGLILANPNLQWPSFRILSHASGEAIDLVHDLLGINKKNE